MGGYERVWLVWYIVTGSCGGNTAVVKAGSSIIVWRWLQADTLVSTFAAALSHALDDL